MMSVLRGVFYTVCIKEVLLNLGLVNSKLLNLSLVSYW